MAMLTFSGSSRPDSSNQRLLNALPALLPNQTFYSASELVTGLPLFRAELDQAPWPPVVLEWRKAVQGASVLLIATPEYLHNLPALVKNALEWLTTSGELHGKPVLPITLTPHTPRGKHAMQSLLWSLKALAANVVGELQLYQPELVYTDGGDLGECPGADLLREVLSLLP